MLIIPIVVYVVFDCIMYQVVHVFYDILFYIIAVLVNFVYQRILKKVSLFPEKKNIKQKKKLFPTLR